MKNNQQVLNSSVDEKLFGLLTASVKDYAIFLIDINGYVLSWNKGAENINGYHKQEVINRHVSVFYKPYDSQVLNLRYHLSKALKHGTCEVEGWQMKKDGTLFWANVTFTPIYSENGFLEGFAKVVKDNTEKKTAEHSRDKMIAELNRRNKDMEQFTYIISHNLRAPVANIKGLSGLLVGKVNNGDQELLSALSASVNSLDTVIVDLNHILQIGSEVNDTTEIVSLKEITNDIRLSIEHLLKEHNGTLVYNFEKLRELRSLKSFLYSIFHNLITNSIKYRRVDAAPVINISSDINHKGIGIIFSDNGKGIDLSKHGENLFGLYKRFDQSVDGKGMGLFMVKKQVESLGGKISVQSKLGVGSTFKIELPISLATQARQE